MNDSEMSIWLDFYSFPWKYADKSWLPDWYSKFDEKNIDVISLIRRKELYNLFSLKKTFLSLPDAQLFSFALMTSEIRLLLYSILDKILFPDKNHELPNSLCKWCVSVSKALQPGILLRELSITSHSSDISLSIFNYWTKSNSKDLWSRIEMTIPKNHKPRFCSTILSASNEKKIKFSM